MWRIVIFAVLLFAVVQSETTNKELMEEMQPLVPIDAEQKPQPSSTETPSKEPSDVPEAASAVQPTQSPPPSSSSSPAALPPSSTEKPLVISEAEEEPSNAMSNRRIITYDQRQEGQYNIRADLENFMIVLIPPGPSEGANLLDLLTKTSFRRNSYGNKSKYKYKEPQSLYSSSSSSGQPSPSTKYRQSIKTGSNNQNFNYLSGSRQPGSNGGAFGSHHPLSIVDNSAARLSEFIEGRTPYRVDISSNDGEQARQVDVLPPPYPLTYQHLIKPFHLEAEPTVIQALPPPAVGSQPVSNGANGVGAITSNSGNFMDTFNQFFASRSLGPGSDSFLDFDDNDQYRINRAIGGSDLSPSDADDIINGNNFDLPLDSNRVSQSRSSSIYDTSLGSSSEDDDSSIIFVGRSHLPVYTEGRIYPPIEVPRLSGFLKLTSNSRTLDVNENKDTVGKIDGDVQFEELRLPPSTLEETHQYENLKQISPNIELVLLGDANTENCGSNQRRDSYGNCRLVDGY